MINIEFKMAESYVDVYPEPVPAKKMVPDWYKKMSRFVDTNEKSLMLMDKTGTKSDGMIGNRTIKTCIPVRDVITGGYLIPIHVDFLIDYVDRDNKKNPGIGHVNNRHGEHLGAHGIEQVKNSPVEKLAGSNLVFKINNPWRIYTDPGYSCHFFSPFFHDLPIEVLPGIVDTDAYHEVNFPFILRSEKINQLPFTLKQGVPYVQVIPFKRETYKMKIGVESDQERERKFAKFNSVLAGWYRDFAHKKKHYN